MVTNIGCESSHKGYLALVLRYVSAMSVAAVVMAWATPASATVCLACQTVPCELIVETLSDCQVVPGNHEIVVRATCPSFVPVDALPIVRRPSGAAVAGEWELMDGSGRFRFVGADFPEGEELHLVGQAPQRCYMADVPSCTSSSLQCLEDDLEPKDCCQLYSEAAEAQAGAADGLGGQGGQGGAGNSAEEPLWLRFFATAADDTPPTVQEIIPRCADNLVGPGTLYWDAAEPFDGVQQVTFSLQGEDDASARLLSWTPCLGNQSDVLRILEVRAGLGAHRIQATYRDWSGNVTVGPEHVVHVPEDCATMASIDWSFACTSPSQSLDQACVESPLPGAAPTTDIPDLCSRGSAGSGSNDLDDVVLDGSAPDDPTLLGSGGTAAGGSTSGTSVTPGRPSGCACSTAGGGRYGRSDAATLLAAFGAVLLLGRRRRGADSVRGPKIDV